MTSSFEPEMASLETVDSVAKAAGTIAIAVTTALHTSNTDRQHRGRRLPVLGGVEETVCIALSGEIGITVLE